jgi:hexosaminidase
MKNKRYGFLLMAAILFVSAPVLAQLNIIPLPKKVEERGSRL